LIETSMQLFAERGLGDVSIRQIIRSSGQGNQSAVNYYFQDKDGLIEAVAVYVNELFQPYLSEALLELGQIKRNRELNAKDIVGAMIYPIIGFYHASNMGKQAVHFLARLSWEYGDRGQALLMRETGPFLVRIERHLVKALPNKPREKIRQQMLTAATSTLFGLATLGNLRHSPFGKGETLYRGKGELAIAHYMDFVCGGLLGR